MYQIQISSSVRNLFLELSNYLHNIHRQPPNPPLMGDYLSLGDTPMTPPEMILGQKEFWTSFLVIPEKPGC
jgi:hypothetical protein